MKKRGIIAYCRKRRRQTSTVKVEQFGSRIQSFSESWKCSMPLTLVIMRQSKSNAHVTTRSLFQFVRNAIVYFVTTNVSKQRNSFNNSYHNSQDLKVIYFNLYFRKDKKLRTNTDAHEILPKPRSSSNSTGVASSSGPSHSLHQSASSSSGSGQDTFIFYFSR